MAQEKILIKFEAKGNKALVRAIEELDNATRELTGRQKKLGDGADNLRNKSRGLNLAFATLRSKMLLFSFAMSMGVKQLLDFAKQSAKIEGMRNAFNTLQGTTDGATIAISRLKEATDGTMNNMDLFKQANNAMVLGITKNSEEMARMFDLAQRLGRALGVDTAHAVESLVTGIGRQSRLMLDNIGIIVKSEEAYEKYAISLGKTASQLTDAQKKQAFLNATLEAAEQKVSEMGEEVLTASDAYSRFGSNVMNVMRAIGDAINVVLVPAMNRLSEVIEFDVDIDIAKSTKTLTILEKAIKQQRENLARDLALPVSLQGQDFVQERIKITQELIKELDARYAELAVSIEKTEESSTEIGQSFEDQLVGIELLNQAYARSLEGQIALKEEQLALAEASALRNDMDTKEAAALVQLQAELDALIAKRSKNNEATLEMLSSNERAFVSFASRLSDVFKDAALNSKDMAETFNKAIRSMAAEIMARAATFALISAFVPGFSSAKGGASFAKFVFGHTGGLIKDNGDIQRFAKSGSVNGGDNVPIMAQGGEFIMSRRAVESVGVETMNRINKTGSAGSINVNVSGNVMTQDFVEGELAFAIKKAARRGSDFGIN